MKILLQTLLFCFTLIITADDNIDLPNEANSVDSNEATLDNIRKKIKLDVPKVPLTAFLELHFDGPQDLESKLIKSEAKKDGVDSALAKYDGIWSVEEPHSSALDQDFGLVMKSKAKHYALSVPLPKSIDFTTHDTLVVQYEVKFQTALDCGGAYIKLLSQQSPPFDLRQLTDKTPYTIMFGPDKCGLDHKLHFIFRHKNPITGAYEEKHAKKSKSDLDKFFTDQKTHLYTLVTNADNKFEIYVDQNLISSGSLLEDFDPSINPSKEINDPEDKKPSDWDEREKIPDPLSKKPDDWDESQPETIVDTDAVKPDGWLDDESPLISDETSEKPSDWDAEMDGEWEAPKIDNPRCKSAPGCGEWKRPTIKNPLYKGKWSAPLIDNPAYRGVWKPRLVPNPHYFEDAEPYRRMTPVFALGLELWSMTDEIVFDNLLITASRSEADDYAAQTWAVKRDEERKADPKAQSVVDAIQEVTREKPWIWAIVALVVGLPLMLIVYFCCIRSSASDDSAARRKKLDLHEPDDDEDGEEQPMAQHSAGTVSAPKSTSKASLESSSEDGEDSVTASHRETTRASQESDRASGSRSRSTSRSRVQAASNKMDLEAENQDFDEPNQVDGEENDGNVSGDKKSNVTKRRSRKD